MVNIPFPHLPSKKLKYSSNNKSSEIDYKEYGKTVFSILLKDTKGFTLDNNPMFVRKMVKASDAAFLLDDMKEYIQVKQYE